MLAVKNHLKVLRYWKKKFCSEPVLSFYLSDFNREILVFERRALISVILVADHFVVVKKMVNEMVSDNHEIDDSRKL